MKKYSAFLAVATLGTAPLIHGATFYDDFTTLGQNPTPSTQGQNLSTYNGWSSGLGSFESLPLAYGYTIGTPSSNAAALGVAFDAPAGSSFSASHSLSTPLAGSTLLTTFVIVDSEAGLGGTLSARNNYSISIASGLTTLFSLNMVAASQAQPSDPAQWNLSGPDNSIFTVAQENGLYNLVVSFVQNGLNVDYNINVAPAGGGGGFSTSGTLAGQAGANIDTLSVNTSIGSGSGWGTGYIGFDNIGLVPEPSSVMLSCLASLGLFRRRRA
jgi:hypothetical protein